MQKKRDYSIKMAKELLAKMTLQEKVGQVNQRLYGFGIYEVKRKNQNEEIELSKEFQDEVQKYGGLGVLYGLYRADPWSKREEKTGLVKKLAPKAYNQIQRYVIEHSRLKIPMLLSSECPHGHQALHGYLLPVNLAMGATFHPALVERAYRVCAMQLKELGVDFALISLLDILRDPRWGRSEECFSEDPYLACELAKAVVRGVQGEGVAVVAKHFCAQGETTGGINASAARIGERELREIHMPAMVACCQEKVQGIMAAYNEIDGVFCHANKWLLKDVLRDEMGFTGVVMADGTAIDRLDCMTGDTVKSAELALRAGVDIGLWDEAYGKLEEAIKQNPELEKDLDEAVLRVLTLKYERGLFEQPFIEEDDHYTTYHYNQYEESLQLARESVILLENKKDILPLSLKNMTSIAVLGPNANHLYHQMGDYSPPVREEDGVTVLKGIQQVAHSYEKKTGRGTKVIWEEGVPLLEHDNKGIAKAITLAKQSDVTILVLGGSSSRFGEVEFDVNGAAIAGENITMDCGEGVDCASLELPGNQLLLAKALYEAKVPTIVVNVAGRPYALEEIAKQADALLVSFYPGIKGGQAIAEILFGEISPSGCLPVSIPRTAGQLPVYYNYKSSYEGMNYYDVNPKALYSFGYGKSYATFAFEDVHISFNDKKEVILTFIIENKGEWDAFCVPQLYIRQEKATTVRRVKELKAFTKIWIPKKEKKEATLILSRDQLSIWNERMQFVVEKGPVTLWLCDQTTQMWTDTITLVG